MKEIKKNKREKRIRFIAICCVLCMLPYIMGNIVEAATVKTVKLSKSALTLTVGKTATLKAIVTPSNATNRKVTFTSSKKSVATVSATGKVKAIKAGTTTITAKTANGKKATCKVTVKAKSAEPISITLSPKNVSLFVGETSTLKATLEPSNADQTLTYTSSDKNALSVSKKGVITAHTAGTYDITATTSNGLKASVHVVVQDVSIGSNSIGIGDSKENVIKILGEPNRIDKTEYSYDFYVYNQDYSDFKMIGIENNKVVAIFTNAKEFNIYGVKNGASLGELNASTQTSNQMETIITIMKDDYTLYVLMDKLETQCVTGILVQDESVVHKELNDTTISHMEKEIFDITNAIRVNHGLKPYIWSDIATTAAKKHSEDMSKNNYFDHISLSGSYPIDRMQAEGIQSNTVGENIIAGFENAIFSTHFWFNSSGHRRNLLEKDFTYLGVGGAKGGYFGDYFTQNFYR